jgi:hypothetical protein
MPSKVTSWFADHEVLFHGLEQPTEIEKEWREAAEKRAPTEAV